MATGAGTVKGSATARYDAYVTQQLARAEGRVRALDLAAGLAGLVALSLAWALVVLLCDRAWELSPRARQVALVVYLAVAALYLWRAVLVPLRRRINPYYAALLVESTLAAAKNSVVNWVDLHDRDLPAGIRGALGQRAARDIGKADIERAVSGRRAAWSAGLAALTCVAFAAAFVALGPGPFSSLLVRALAPFRGGAIATRTQIHVIQPAGGNAVAAVGRPVTISAEVLGRVPDSRAPDALRLQYRYEAGEPYLERGLQPGERREWNITLPAIDVRNGLYYRVAGGDFVTAEYRITVRAEPFLTSFLATYHYRPYVGRADEVRRERELKALRGTEVILRSRTNRTLADARVEWEGKGGTRTMPARVLSGDSRDFEVRLVIDEDGRYRLAFTSTEGETWSESTAYAVTAVPDRPPEVELTRPAKDMVLPADALLELEGKATDDIGVQGVSLQARLIGGPKIRPRPYRGKDGLRLTSGGYPTAVDYKDFLDLGKLDAEDGHPVTLRPGSELEYWLEAADACDFDRPNVAQSKHYKVQIAEPRNDAARQKQERQRAEQDGRKHQQQQDRQLEDENKARQQDAREQEKRNEAERGKDQEAGNPQGSRGQPKEGAESGHGHQSTGQKPDSAPQPQPDKGSNDVPQNKSGNDERNSEAGSGLTKKQSDEAQRLKDALERNKKQGSQDTGGSQDKAGQGESPGQDKPDKGQSGGADRAPDSKPDGDTQPAGEGKGAGQQSRQDAGQGKEQGKSQPGAGAKASERKSSGQKDVTSEPQGDGKKQQDNGAQGAGQGKGGQGQPQAQPNAGAKRSGSPQARDQAGERKPDGHGGTNTAGPEGQAKPSAKGDAQTRAGEAKRPAGDSHMSEAHSNAQPRSGTQPESGTKNGTDRRQEQGGRSGKPARGSTGDRRERGAGQLRADSGNARAGSQETQVAEQATPGDVERLGQDLKQGDAGQRREAQRKLEQIQERATDPEARQAAGKKLHEAAEKSGGSPPGSRDGQSQGPGKQANAGGQKPREQPGGRGSDSRVKDADGDPKKGGRSQGHGNQDMGKSGESRGGRPGTRLGPGERPAGNDPGAGASGERTDVNRPPADTAEPPPIKGARSAPHRPSVLQLEEFRKKVNKDVLKDARMSEEEFRRFLRAYQEAVRRQSAGALKPETAPQAHTSGPLPSFSKAARKPNEDKSDDLGPEGRPLPPAPYRDPYSKFTRELSRPKK
jgi:hypothetical protein